MINSCLPGKSDPAFPSEGKVPRERRMRWPHFSQNSAESTLKGPFLAEKLRIRSGDTSSVTFGDSFPSRGSLTDKSSYTQDVSAASREKTAYLQYSLYFLSALHSASTFSGGVGG